MSITGVDSQDFQGARRVVGAFVDPEASAGALVELACSPGSGAVPDAVKRPASHLARHATLAKPTYVSRENVPPEIVTEEHRLLFEMLRLRLGQPPSERMVNGLLEQFFARTCLLEQADANDGHTTIARMIRETESTTGCRLRVVQFSRIG